MRASFFLFAVLAVAGLQTAAADRQHETTQYTFGANQVARPQLPSSSRSASLTHVNTLKSAVKGSRDEARPPSVKKRVRFFVHEDGDVNLIDNQGNDYISTDEEREDDNEYTFGVPALSPRPATGNQSPPPRSASWSAVARQRQERAALEQETAEANPVQRNDFEVSGARTVQSSTMELKRQITSSIRMTESKIEFLLEMIAEQKQERGEAARFNLSRMKLIDFRQQSRIWNARIRLLKHELKRQKDDLQYYEEKLVMVQRRLEMELRNSQRLSAF